MAAYIYYRSIDQNDAFVRVEARMLIPGGIYQAPDIVATVDCIDKDAEAIHTEVMAQLIASFEQQNSAPMPETEFVVFGKPV